MACLLQPECNFLHSFFRCKLPVEVVDMEVKITSMQGTHIFRGDRITQSNAHAGAQGFIHTPQSLRKWRPFWKWRVRWVQFQHPVVNSCLHSQTPITTSEKTMSLKKEREPHLRSLDQQPPYLPQDAHPCQRPHQNLRMMDPYHQYRWVPLKPYSS